MDDTDQLGLPAGFVARNMSAVTTPSEGSSSPLFIGRRNRSFELQPVKSSSGLRRPPKSRSMTSLATVRSVVSSSISSSPGPDKPILKGVLKPSRSLPQLSSIASQTSLTSIPEGENEDEEENEEEVEQKSLASRDSKGSNGEEQAKNLHWGGVEEYIPNDDSDSRASSGRTDMEATSSEEEEEEDDGWGWFESESHAHAAEKDRRAARQESQQAESRPARERKPLVRVLSQSTPLDPEIDNSRSSGVRSNASDMNSNKAPTGGSLLLLGSQQWPERRSRKRRDRARQSDFFQTNSTPKGDEIAKNYLLEVLVQETRSKGYPITMSAFLIFSRGAATGYALRAIPNYFLRIAMWFYSEKAPSNGKESLRTGLFLGLSMASYHVMAMNNVAVPDADGDNSDLMDDEEQQTIPSKDRWIPVTAAVMTPLLAILPAKSRLSMALFVAARASEAVINGSLFRLSRNLREQLPVSKWLFALGSAQVVFTWLFHRSALPTELATFLDKASSVTPDSRLVELLQTPNKATYEEAFKVIQSVVRPPEGESLIKRVLLGSGLIELIASDVFSAASLFGPVFAFPHEFYSSLGRGFRSAGVLVVDAMLSGFALVSLSRLLRRVAPSNGWWAGFVAGLIAIQGEILESRRVEIALFALTYAVRALYNIAASKQIIPAQVRFGEYGLYFVSLLVVLKAATDAPAKRMSDSEENSRRKKQKRTLLLGSTFRTMIKRCIIPG